MSHTNVGVKFGWMAMALLVPLGAFSGCDQTEREAGPGGDIAPFSVSARVQDATVEDVTQALARYIHSVDDTGQGLVADWIVAGGAELPEGAEAEEAALRLPGGVRVVEVCNHHYASQAMSFGGHHGVALPCEISIHQQGDDVEVVLLNPEAIFSLFFGDVPPEHAEAMAGMAAAVRGELEGLIESALVDFSADLPRQDVGPRWNAAEVASFAELDYSVPFDVEIPEAYRGSDEDRQAFRDQFVNALLQVATHEDMDQVGSAVEGLSTNDWRSARTHALHLPAGVSIVEMCSPTYAAAALSTGAYHGPALPCEIAIYISGDTLHVDILDPTFIFSVFFSDAPDEMKAEMGGMAAAVRGDLERIVAAASDHVMAG